jgi:hypothetical protein
MFRNVEPALNADALAIQRARAKVSASVGSPLVGEDGTSVEIDLEQARFVSSAEAVNRFAGTLQVIFRRSDSGDLRWGFDEPDLPIAATRELRAAVRGDALLFEASLRSPLPLSDPAFVERLSTWIALRGGFTGALTRRADQGLLFLALHIHSASGDDRWCSSCGGIGPYFDRDGVSLCRACSRDLRALGEPHPFDSSRVVFEGTLRTPLDILTLRAAFGSAPNLALTAPGISEGGGEPARALCLFCGASRGEVIVLNDAFVVCSSCAEAAANAFESS